MNYPLTSTVLNQFCLVWWRRDPNIHGRYSHIFAYFYLDFPFVFVFHPEHAKVDGIQ